MNFRYLLKLIIPCLIILLLCGFAIWERKMSMSLPIDSILKEKASGTPIRLEREYKLGLETDDENIFSQPSIIIKGLYDELNRALANKNEWSISSLLKNFYYCTYTPKDYLFRDFYIDTADNFNRKNSVSYRLRHRWKSYNTYATHVLSQSDQRFFPIRCEVQVKTDRKELGNGYSNVYETRFEFRDSSLPFSDLNPAPQPPWDFEEYLQYTVTGRFMNYVMSPVQEYAKFVRSKQPSEKRLWLKPNLITLTRRFRIHLNISTPWGSGPNPDNVFIVSMDLSEVFGPEYIDYLLKSKYGRSKIEPLARGHLREIEIEFERNVSTVLDKQIEDLKNKGDSEELYRLVKVREAFLADQVYLEKIIKDYFRQIGINLIPLKQSKYASAFDIVSEQSNRR